MALETMKNVREIGGYKVMTNDERPKTESGEVDWGRFDEMRKDYPVCVDHEQNMISFKIQNGPIKEEGINGCQVDTLVAVARKMITELNSKFPCRENALAVTKLQEAEMWLNERKREREARGVEGYSKA